jgi:hypothetical protein
MSQSSGRIFKEVFGWVSLICFVVFSVNVVIGKLSVINQWGWGRPDGYLEFLLLFLATGCFIAYSATSNLSDQNN